MAGWLRRHRGLIPYLFLLPGGLWLIVFFVLPMLTMASVALQEGSLSGGYRLTFNFGIFPEVLGRWDEQFLRSLLYGFVVAVLTMAIGYPMAYTIAFRGGRYKSILLLLVIMPFFTSFITRALTHHGAQQGDNRCGARPSAHLCQGYARWYTRHKSTDRKSVV